MREWDVRQRSVYVDARIRLAAVPLLVLALVLFLHQDTIVRDNRLIVLLLALRCDALPARRDRHRRVRARSRHGPMECRRRRAAGAGGACNHSLYIRAVGPLFGAGARWRARRARRSHLCRPRDRGQRSLFAQRSLRLRSRGLGKPCWRRLGRARPAWASTPEHSVGHGRARRRQNIGHSTVRHCERPR